MLVALKSRGVGSEVRNAVIEHPLPCQTKLPIVNGNERPFAVKLYHSFVENRRPHAHGALLVKIKKDEDDQEFYFRGHKSVT